MGVGFKLAVLFTIAAHTAIAVIAGWQSGDWQGGIIMSLMVFVFFTGLPLMIIASLDGDRD